MNVVSEDNWLRCALVLGIFLPSYLFHLIRKIRAS